MLTHTTTLLGVLSRKATVHLGAVYLGAISLVGLEAVAFLFTFTTAWPIALPCVVLVLGGVYLLRGAVAATWSRLRRPRR